MDDEIEKRRRQKIESRMSEEDRKEAQNLEQQTNTESDYKLLKMKTAKQQSYSKISVIVAIVVGVVTAIIQMLGYRIQLVPFWSTPQLILLLHYFGEIRRYQLSNDLLADLLKSQETLSKLYKYAVVALEYAGYLSNFIKGVVISMAVFILIAQ